MFKKLLQKFDDHCSLYVLLKIIGVLMILYLLIRTQSVWGSWASMLVSIMTPFVTGFVIAYIMSPLVEFLKKERDTEKLFNISHLGLIDHINYRIDRDADTSTVYKSEFLYYEYYRRGTVDQ